MTAERRARMSEVLSHRSVRAGHESGWHVQYRLRLDDGRTVVVDASCSPSAEALIRSAEGRAYIADSGRARALAEAESNPPGITHIRLWVDATTGRVRVDPR